MLHKEKVKQCKTLLSKACSARIGGWEEQQQKETFYKGELWFISFLLIAGVGKEEKDEGER